VSSGFGGCVFWSRARVRDPLRWARGAHLALRVNTAGRVEVAPDLGGESDSHRGALSMRLLFNLSKNKGHELPARWRLDSHQQS
jgi:hypothetical protein